jgi:acyl-CoA synthetase (NDP forming)/GNAT superfamily N-acetyltransferase
MTSEPTQAGTSGTSQVSDDAVDTGYGVRSADVLLHDGTIATIRPMTAGDLEGIRELHARLGEQGYRWRFFGSGARLAEDYLHHLAAAGQTIALLAEQEGRPLALATAEPLGRDAAEVSFAVAENTRGLGLGSLLLEHLAAEGRRRGLARFIAHVMAENTGMLDVFGHAGFAEAHRNVHGTVELTLTTDLTMEALDAADAKERAAQAESLRPLLQPRSVAVAGVRVDGSGVGAAIVRSIVEGGFGGALAVVHPSLEGVEGIGVWRRFSDIPGQVDLAVVAVPARAVLEVLTDAAAAGVRAAVVVSAGFEELGAEGREAQRAILDLARRTSMRIVGPNCLGLLCHAPGELLDATFGDETPPRGSVVVASQSGGVGIALLDVAHELALGLRYFVSLGNKVDVSGNDLLAAWTDDDEVSAALLYLESFGNPLKFARLARTFARRKPLLAVTGGSSTSGARAGASHTAAAATPAAAVGALFAQAGVIACASAEEMAGTALLLTQQPPPRGRRVGIVTNAGGMGVIAADTAEQLILEVPAFTEPLRRRLMPQVNGTAGIGNPVDAGAGATPDQLEVLAEAMLASGEIDALLAVVVPTRVSDGDGVVRRLIDVAARPHAQPIMVVPIGSLWRHHRPAGSVAYPSVEVALRSLAHAATYAAWRSTPPTTPPPLDRARARRGAAVVGARSPAGAEGGWLDASGIADLLTPYGLTPMGTVARGADAAVAAATTLGYPVVVKAGRGDIVHKTERGLVRLHLGSAVEVRTAVEQIEDLLAPGDTSVVVQPMSAGIEIALGVVRDDRFGPLVMVAAGGIHTDVWQDRCFLIPPISRDAAARAVHGLRIFPVLAGHRGIPPADVDALIEMVVRVGLVAEEVPDVAELDVNPVHVDRSGCRIVDVKLRVAAAPALDAGVPRRLRDRP